MKPIHFLFLAWFCSCELAVANISGLKSPNSFLKNFESDREVSDINVIADVSQKIALKQGEATVISSTFNLAKSVIGAGVLSLPSGIAYFSDSPFAILPASVLCATMGVVAAYSFSLIGKSCDLHKTSSFQETFAKSVSKKFAFLISIGITFKCFFASLAYSIIIGDSFTSLAKTFSLPTVFASRSNVIIGITALILFPLCSLQSLNALAPFSLLGLGGTLYTALFMFLRYLDKSYLPGGKFVAAVAPSFGTRPVSFDKKLFILVSMLSTSFIAHYNAPKFYAELKDATVSKFNQVIQGAFAIAICTFVFIMSVGFLSFGGTTQGFVLNNYHGKDSLATFARIALGGALLTGYPFTFSALKEGISDLIGLKDKHRADASLPLTVILLGIVTSIALKLRDVGFVVSLSGAMFGNVLMFIVPAMMANGDLSSKRSLSKTDKIQIMLNYLMITAGVIMTVLGVKTSIDRQLAH